MSTVTFLSLPAEIHISIAENCKASDLINLCSTAKRLNERCLHLLYRSVDLRLKKLHPEREDCPKIFNAQRKRQEQFIHTMLSHPEHGQHVRIWKAKLLPHFDKSQSLRDGAIPEEEFWRALRSLTHVRSVDLTYIFSRKTAPTKPIPNELFQSATSVRIVGQSQYGLIKSILNSINPATLKHLCLILVQDFTIRHSPDLSTLGHGVEDEQKSALYAKSGLLTNLTGRCTALRTLILRRVGQSRAVHSRNSRSWRAVAEETSYIEWASFIHSVQGTVEWFTFEQTGVNSEFDYVNRSNRTIDERFRRLVLPVIVTGNWPCLKIIELRGAGTRNVQMDPLRGKRNWKRN